jgi:hypothetical protein
MEVWCTRGYEGFRMHGFRWLAVLLVLLGCTPSIGDHCVLSTDCSSRGDRLCDTSQPGGYCTIFSCLGNDCPTESICVLFADAVPGCAADDRHEPPRTGRSMCLKACNTSPDCRQDLRGDGITSAYVCADPRSDPYNGTILTDRQTSVCLVNPAGGIGAPQDKEAPVCSPKGPDVPDIDAQTIDAQTADPDAGD